MRRGRWLVVFLALWPVAGLAEDGRAARLNQEGNRLYQEGKLEEALNRYAEGLALDPGSSALHYNLGNALYRAGRYEEALDAYAEAVAGQQIGTDLGQAARFNEGTTSLQAEDFESAVRSLREAVVADPGDEDGRHNLELALARMQQEQQEEQEQEQKGEQNQEQSGEEGERDSSEPQEGEDEQEQDQKGERQGEQNEDPQGEPPPNPQGDPQDEPPGQPEGSEPTPAEERQDLSEEEARRLLAALARDEREELKESLEKPKKRTSGGGRDW